MLGFAIGFLVSTQIGVWVLLRSARNGDAPAENKRFDHLIEDDGFDTNPRPDLRRAA